MDLQNLIEDLEEIIENASKVPLSNKCMIDRDEVWEVIQQFRLSFPEEIKQAQYIKKERERIISDARQEAKNIVETGKQEVVMMVNETEILKLAQQKADELLKDAEIKAVEIRHAAEDEGKEIVAEATDKANAYKKQAKELAGNFLSQIEEHNIHLRDCIFRAYNEIGETYQESSDLLTEITSYKNAVLDSIHQDE